MELLSPPSSSRIGLPHFKATCLVLDRSVITRKIMSHLSTRNYQ